MKIQEIHPFGKKTAKIIYLTDVDPSSIDIAEENPAIESAQAHFLQHWRDEHLASKDRGMSYGIWLQEKFAGFGIHIPEDFIDPTTGEIFNVFFGPPRSKALFEEVEVFLNNALMHIKNAKHTKALREKLHQSKKNFFDVQKKLFPADTALLEALFEKYVGNLQRDIADILSFSDFVHDAMGEIYASPYFAKQDAKELQEALDVHFASSVLFDAMVMSPVEVERAFKQKVLHRKLRNTIEKNAALTNTLLELQASDEVQARYLSIRLLFEFACFHGLTGLIHAICALPWMDHTQLTKGPYLYRAIKSNKSKLVLETLADLGLINATYEGSYCPAMDDEDNQITPLHLALILEKPEEVRLLLHYLWPYVPENIEDLLVYAVRRYMDPEYVGTSKQFECLMLLVKQGADLEKLNLFSSIHNKASILAHFFYPHIKRDFDSEAKEEHACVFPPLPSYLVAYYINTLFSKTEAAQSMDRLQPEEKAQLAYYVNALSSKREAAQSVAPVVDPLLLEEKTQRNFSPMFSMFSAACAAFKNVPSRTHKKKSLPLFLEAFDKKIPPEQKTTGFAIFWRDYGNTPYKTGIEGFLKKLPLVRPNFTIDSGLSSAILSTLFLTFFVSTGGNKHPDEKNGVVLVLYTEKMAERYWMYKLRNVYSVLGRELDIALHMQNVMLVDFSSGDPVMLDTSLEAHLMSYYKNSPHLQSYYVQNLQLYKIARERVNNGAFAQEEVSVYIILDETESEQDFHVIAQALTPYGYKVYASRYSHEELTEFQHAQLADKATVVLVLWTIELWDKLFVDYMTKGVCCREMNAIETAVVRLFEQSRQKSFVSASLTESEEEVIPPFLKHLSVCYDIPDIIERIQEVVRERHDFDSPEFHLPLPVFNNPYPADFVEGLPLSFDHEEIVKVFKPIFKKHSITLHIIATPKQQGGLIFKKLVQDFRKLGLRVSYGGQHFFKAYDADVCVVMAGEELAKAYQNISFPSEHSEEYWSRVQIEIAILRFHEMSRRACSLVTVLEDGNFKEKIPSGMKGRLHHPIAGDLHSAPIREGKIFLSIFAPFGTRYPEKATAKMRKIKCASMEALQEKYPALSMIPANRASKEPRYEKGSKFSWVCVKNRQPNSLYEPVVVLQDDRYTVVANVCWVRREFTKESLEEKHARAEALRAADPNYTAFVDCSILIQGVSNKLPLFGPPQQKTSPCITISPAQADLHVAYNRDALTMRAREEAGEERLDYYDLQDVGGKPMPDLGACVLKELKKTLQKHMAIPPGSYKEILHDLLIQLASQLPEKVDEQFISIFKASVENTYPIWSSEILKKRGCEDPIEKHPKLAHEKIAIKLKNGSYIFPKLPPIIAGRIVKQCAFYLQNRREMTCKELIDTIHKEIVAKHIRKEDRLSGHRLSYAQKQQDAHDYGWANRYCVPSATDDAPIDFRYDGDAFPFTNAVIKNFTLQDSTGVIVCPDNAQHAFSAERGLVTFLESKTKKRIKKYHYFEKEGDQELQSEVDAALATLNALGIGRFQIVGNTFKLVIAPDMPCEKLNQFVAFLKTQTLPDQEGGNPNHIDLSNIGPLLQKMSKDLCAYVAKQYPEENAPQPYRHNPIVGSMHTTPVGKICAITFKGGPVKLLHYLKTHDFALAGSPLMESATSTPRVEASKAVENTPLPQKETLQQYSFFSEKCAAAHVLHGEGKKQAGGSYSLGRVG